MAGRVSFFIHKFSLSVLQRSKLLDDSVIKVGDVFDKVLLYRQHGQGVETILRHGVPVESLDPLHGGEAPLGLRRGHRSRDENLQEGHGLREGVL